MGTLEQADAYCVPVAEPEFNAGEIWTSYLLAVELEPESNAEGSCWTLWSRFLLASILALFLQWSTTVTAMFIACRSATGK
jgi:hypothetical protein